MVSTLSWLDYTDEDQRRARELLALFSETESRDELGIGSIRDALSDLMFPGISVTQTRARYFLFIPWLFLDGARRGYEDEALNSWVQQRERDLIGILKAGGDEEGLIGRNVGWHVKTLPSTLFWGGLQRFGIVRTDGSMLDLAAATRRRGTWSEETLTELAYRSPSPWQAPPRPPEGWPYPAACDFRLTPEEADWLRERMIGSEPGSLLAFLALHRARPTGAFPWDDPTVRSAPEPIAHIVTQAERFAVAIHGAALLYNLLLAEHSLEMQLLQDDRLVTRYRRSLESWTAEVRGHELARTEWNSDDLWSVTATASNRIPEATRWFVSGWLNVARAAGWDITDSEDARRLIKQRERRKGSQSRFANERLLKQWGGAAGTGRLPYRWPQVTRILGDMVDGLERADA